MDILSLHMGLIGVCLGRDGLAVWGGMGEFLLETGRGSGGKSEELERASEMGM